MREETVAFVLLAGFQGGGTERVVARLIADLQVDHRVVLISNEGPEGDKYPAPAGVERQALRVEMDEQRFADRGVVGTLIPMWRLLQRLRRLLRTQRPATVVSWLTSANLLTILATRGLGMRVIVAERSDTVRERQPAVIRAARWLLYRCADVVTANSPASITDMQRYVPARRLVRVTNAVDLPRDAADPATARDVLIVGRLIESKDPMAALEAFVDADLAAAGWTLTFVGDGPLRAALAAAADRSEIGEAVRLVGFVDDPSAYYRRAAVSVMTSRYEGSPNVVLEAMAAGLPNVVPDDLIGAVELVEDGVNGLIYRRESATGLAACLRALAGDARLRTQMGRAARQRAVQHDPAVIASHWRELIVT